MSRRRSRLRLRDRFFQPGVARAITSPAGIAGGAVVAGGLIAGGAHPVLCALAGLVGWGVPVVRAMQRVPGLGGRRRLRGRAGKGERGTKPDPWTAAIIDAEAAADRFEATVERYRDGPLLDRLRELEEDVFQSLEAARELARTGCEAEAARRELAPARLQREGRRAGRAAEDAAASQRRLATQLAAVEDEARTKLVLLNGRLDEAVGRATELLARSVLSPDERSGSVVDEVAKELERLSAALHEVEPHEHPHRGPVARSKGTTATG